MKQHEIVFLEILKAGMWGVRPQVPEGFDEWLGVVRLAKSQSVLGVVGNGLLSDAELSQRIPKDLRDKVKRFVMSSMMTHNLLNGTLVKVVSVLRDNGVESVLLKGQGIARYYPQPELRQCGDIDLYVGLDNAAKAYDILSPVAAKVDERERIDKGKHYHVTMPEGVEVEVHRLTDLIVSSKRNKIYQTASDKGTSTGLVTYDFGGTAVNTPADDFNAFFIFNHLFHHFLTSGIGLRQFCDWMMFLHARKGRLDLEYLGKLLSDMDMMKPWKAFGCVLVKLLGMPEEEFPFYDRRQENKVGKIIRRVFDEGNFGKERSIYKNRGTNYLLNKTRSLCGHMSKASALLFLFPSQTLTQFGNTLASGFSAVWTDFRIKVSGLFRRNA